MTERYHAIPRDLFDALAAGGGGPEAIGVLAAAEHSKHDTLLRGVLAAAQRADADQARRARLAGRCWTKSAAAIGTRRPGWWAIPRWEPGPSAP